MRQRSTELRHFVSIATLIVMLAACAEPVGNKSFESNVTVALTVTKNSERQTTTDILSQAEQKYGEAKDLEHAWKATRAQIEIAHRAIKDNDEEKARASATRALFTANASVKQAIRGREDWLTHVVK
ncbi:MAG: hypothetical protein ACI8W1_001394 [Candidatus Azotimanducaceae bacterium]|jgi:hypothetical protein